METEKQLDFTSNLHELNLKQLKELRNHINDKACDKDKEVKLKLIDISIEGRERIKARDQIKTWNETGLETVGKLLVKKNQKTKEEQILLDEILRELRRRDNGSNFEEVSAS